MGIDFYTGRNSQRDQTERFHMAASLPLTDGEHSTHVVMGASRAHS